MELTQNNLQALLLLNFTRNYLMDFLVYFATTLQLH